MRASLQSGTLVTSKLVVPPCGGTQYFAYTVLQTLAHCLNLVYGQKYKDTCFGLGLEAFSWAQRDLSRDMSLFGEEQLDRLHPTPLVWPTHAWTDKLTTFMDNNLGGLVVCLYFNVKHTDLWWNVLELACFLSLTAQHHCPTSQKCCGKSLSLSKQQINTLGNRVHILLAMKCTS